MRVAYPPSGAPKRGIAGTRAEFSEGLVAYYPCTDAFEKEPEDLDLHCMIEWGIALGGEQGTNALTPSTTGALVYKQDEPRFGRVLYTPGGAGVNFSEIRLPGLLTEAGINHSIQCWFKITALEDYVYLWDHISGGGVQNSTLVLFGDGTIRYQFQIGGVFKLAASAAGSIRVSNWYHALVTMDGEVTRLYVNGVQSASAAAVGTPDAAGTRWRLVNAVGDGSLQKNKETWFTQWAFWNRTLGPDDAVQLAMSPYAVSGGVGRSTDQEPPLLQDAFFGKSILADRPSTVDNVS